MRRYLEGAWVGLMLGAFACTAKPPVVPQPPAAATAELEAEPQTPPEIPETALKELLDQWLAAQNQGQFAAYEGLYATKFFGIKRSGPRELRFDRGAWLNDRKRMFQKPMQVEAREPKFQAAITSAQVVFTQHFASGNFEDLGEKRLLIVLESGKLRIEHEEMLRSDLVVSAGKQARRAQELYLTLTLDSGVYVLLPEASVPTKLGGYHNESGEDNPDIYTVSRSVRDGDLDASVSSLKGQKLRLEDGCVATVNGFRVISRVIPHFGERQRWSGISEDDDVRLKPLSEAQVARAAYKLGVAELFGKLEGCKDGGRFALLESSPAPVVGEKIEDHELEKRALAEFIKLPGVLESQRDYLESSEGVTGHWWDENISTAVYKHPVSGQKLVSVLAGLEGEHCRDFSASAWVVYEQQGKSLKLLMPERTPPSEVQDAIDVDGDGQLELLVGSHNDLELIRLGTERSGPALSIIDLDCHC